MLLQKLGLVLSEKMENSNDDPKDDKIELTEIKESRGWIYQEIRWKECEGEWVKKELDNLKSL